MNYGEKTALNNEYSSALGTFAKDNSDGYININSELEKTLKLEPRSKYLLDYIHPNSSNGVLLYSKYVLSVQ